MKLFHVNVVCSDLERSYKFYTDVLGLAPLTRRTAGIGDSKSATDGKSQSVRDGRLPGEARQSGDDAAKVKRALGLGGIGDNRGILLYWEGSPEGPFIDLLEYTDPGEKVVRSAKELGLARIAMTVDNIDEHVARLKAHDVTFVSEPESVTLGVTAIKIGTPRVRVGSWVPRLSSTAG